MPPNDFAAPHALPQGTFDAPLVRAAQELIDMGAVADVRILQTGRVVTGIVGGLQRVYLQYQRTATTARLGSLDCRSEKHRAFHRHLRGLHDDRGSAHQGSKEPRPQRRQL